MSHGRKPTPAQAEAISNFGIAVPPTRAAARRILEFIKVGNTAGQAKSKEHRIAMLIDAQKQWVGRRVMVEGLSGLVDYICPKNGEEVRKSRGFIVDLYKGDPKSASPFFAHLVWDDPKKAERKQTLQSLGWCELIP